MKCIRVGDPHVTVRNLEDSKKLIDFIIEQAKKYEVGRVEFMGDLFHTHAIKRLEVEDFWLQSFYSIVTSGFKVLALVGNHDIPGSREKDEISALSTFAFMKDVQIIGGPGKIIDNIAYIAYRHHEEDFLSACRHHYKRGAKKTLVAHQTFTGAAYENGFYAEDGIDPELAPQEHIISGHIHRQQIIGKCHYIGTPKWDTVNDANEEKGIWYYEHGEDGDVLKSEFISTKDIVTPISKYIVNEGEEVPKLNPNGRNYLEFVGKTAWISKMKKKYKGQAKIKGVPTDRKTVSIDRDKILNIYDYLEKHFEISGNVKKEHIKSYLKEVVNV